MQVKTSKGSDGLTLLTITPEAGFLAAIKERILKQLAGEVKIAGFRSGKAPLSMVEKHVDQRVLSNQFIDTAISDSYEDALKQTGISPLTEPSITLKKFVPFTTVEYEVEVLTTEDVKLADYKKIKKARPQAKVTDKDVDDVLESLRQRSGQRKEVKRSIKKGDEVILDFKGTDKDGKPINGAEGRDYPLLIGSDVFIPGFEENLIGVKAGDEKTFTLNFPKNYRINALKGKKVTFDVKVKSVSELILADIDDKFVSSVSPFKKLDELKDDIKKQLAHERTHQLKNDLGAEIIREIIAKSNIPAPESLLRAQIQREIDTLKQNLAYRGQTWNEFLEIENLSEEEFVKQKISPAAEEKVKGGLALSAIAEKEQLVITPQEFEARLQMLKGQYKDPAMQAELDKAENRRDIFSRLLTEKTLARLLEITTK